MEERKPRDAHGIPSVGGVGLLAEQQSDGNGAAGRAVGCSTVRLVSWGRVCDGGHCGANRRSELVWECSRGLRWLMSGEERQSAGHVCAVAPYLICSSHVE